VRSFAPTERFVNEVEQRKLKPGYVFLGDEAFFRKQCRDAILKHLVPPDVREFSLYEFDLSDVGIGEVLDRARTPSLMAPFQVFFVRGIKNLYGRGKHDDEFAAINDYFKNPNPDALLIFVADHISIPADVRKMDMQDKDRYEKIRETLGDHCGLIEFARVEESEAGKWAMQAAQAQGVKLEPDAARELVDSLGGDMMLLANELEKLALYVGEKRRITLGDVETMVLAAKQRSLYELTDAISQHDRVKALQVLDAILSTGEGDEAAIGHLYMLARTFRQMLVISERNVRDSRALWQVLWQGFRVPPFAAEDVIRQARRFKSRRELTRAIRLIAKADLAVRSNPPSKRLVLENLILDLASEPRVMEPSWQQEELPV
jgi:DNA polymerase-3 subunit delta